MTYTRYGKCETCGTPCKQEKDFTQTIDMFEPESEQRIDGELVEVIRTWRNEPLYCKEHAR